MANPAAATGEGTSRYQRRHAGGCAPGHFRQAGDLAISSLGIGTYLGDPDDETDARVTDAVVEAVRHGINLIDTAINYRHQRAERSVGAALRRLFDAGTASREELVICTKGGFVPAGGNPAAWFQEQYGGHGEGFVDPGELVAGCHCMHPTFLRDQLERSLDNLGIGQIDVYYLHNPETQLAEATPEIFWERLERAFEALELACSQGLLGAYGLATWSALRSMPQDPEHLELADLKAVARKAAGGEQDHLRFVQLPFNLAMPEALLATQEMEGEGVPVVEAAVRLGISPVASASMCQAKIIGAIPPALAEQLGPGLTEAQQALQFTRSAPGFLAALVGMKHPDHVKENLALCPIKPLDPRTFLAALNPSG